LKNGGSVVVVVDVLVVLVVDVLVVLVVVVAGTVVVVVVVVVAGTVVVVVVVVDVLVVLVVETVGPASVIASGPAAEPLVKLPPRISTPGAPVVSRSPFRHCSSPVDQAPQGATAAGSESGTESATHSDRLPTMSKAPLDDTQASRDPVGTAVCVLAVLHVKMKSSGSPGPRSGVPATAACHSVLVGSLLREFLHACCAWNQVMCADG
jgi:hypothetical protein